jgi:hypothetical protein
MTMNADQIVDHYRHPDTIEELGKKYPTKEARLARMQELYKAVEKHEAKMKPGDPHEKHVEMKMELAALARLGGAQTILVEKPA